MSFPPTYAVPPTFLGTSRHDPASPICVAGIPYDIGTTNRSGARSGPAAIRTASRMLVDGAHPQHWVDPVDLPFADIGDFATALGDIAASMKLIEEQARNIAHLMTLGGDHSITLPLLRAIAGRRGPVALLHFDAHVNTWPDNFGQPLGHGSVFYRAIEEGLVQPHRMIQVGIRSPVQREVYDWTIERGVTILTAQDVHAMGPAAVTAQIRKHYRRWAGLPEFRHRRARPRFRARHRNAGNRRPRQLAGAGRSAQPRRHPLRRHGRGRSGAGL